MGEPLAERSYGGDCIIYDPEVPDNPWHNVYDKFDAFVPTHFIGTVLNIVERKCFMKSNQAISQIEFFGLFYFRLVVENFGSQRLVVMHNYISHVRNSGIYTGTSAT